MHLVSQSPHNIVQQLHCPPASWNTIISYSNMPKFSAARSTSLPFFGPSGVVRVEIQALLVNKLCALPLNKNKIFVCANIKRFDFSTNVQWKGLLGNNVHSHTKVHEQCPHRWKQKVYSASNIYLFHLYFYSY